MISFTVERDEARDRYLIRHRAGTVSYATQKRVDAARIAAQWNGYEGYDDDAALKQEMEQDDEQPQ